MRTHIERPILYIDYLQHIERAVGVTYSFNNFDEVGLDNRDFYGFRPSGKQKRVVFNPDGASFGINFNKPIPAKFFANVNYVALFGHNFASNNIIFKLTATDTNGISRVFWSSVAGDTMSINAGTTTWVTDPIAGLQYDNFSIISVLPDNVEIVSLEFEINSPIESFNDDAQLTLDISSISIGQSFLFPHSVDLASSVAFMHDGIKVKQTPMGRDLIQSTWTHPPNHGDFVPFQLYHGAGSMPNLEIARRSGRAEFNFQVSFFSDTQLIPKFNLPHDTVGTDIAHGHTPVLDSTIADGTMSGGSDLGTLLNIFTYGGNLPMMLCANSENKHENGWIKTDSFYIVRNEDKGFEYKPVAPDLYNMSFKLVETW